MSGLGYHRWTEEEAKTRLLIDEGDYKMQITTITRGRTKDGAHGKLTINFAFNDSSGKQKTMMGWIIFMEGMDWTLRHLCRSADSIQGDTKLIDLYDAETLDIPHLVGRTVISRVKIKDGDKGKMNSIVDYLTSGSEKLKSGILPIDDFKASDDIPF